MTLDIGRHRTILFLILKDMYSDSTIAPFLGFKGGTAALLFHGLDRFSVDLDFDLLDESKEDAVFDRVIAIVKKHGIVKESFKKRFNLFCLLSYEETAHNIKIEINRRQFGSKYEIKTYLGVSMQVMVAEDMVAHKLMAMYERLGKTSRDMYDVWFFLKQRFPINKVIVEKRSGMPFQKAITECINKIEHLPDNQILQGVGELLTTSQKDWAKAKLRTDTVMLLQLLQENN